MTSRAEHLLELALTDPRSALDAGEVMLSALDETQQLERSEIGRAMSMAARYLNDLELSVELARQAALEAEDAGLMEQQLMALLTMSGSLAGAGQIENSLEVIESGLEVAVDPHLRARFVFQRGAVLHHAGHPTQAIDDYLASLTVFRDVDDGFSIGLALNRLGLAYTEVGQISEAEIYLVEALEMARDRNELAAEHGIMHNIGLLHFYRGDIPEALDWLERSDDLYMEVSGHSAPQHVARAEVLLSAGRFEEALDGATHIADFASARKDVEHEGAARLVAARAALLAGRPDEARQQADKASALYEQSGMSIRKSEADAISVEAQLGSAGASRSLLADAQEVMRALEREKLAIPSAQARFVAARAASEMGARAVALAHLEHLSGIKSGPLEIRLLAASARTQIAEMEGNRGAALRAARDGLRLIDSYQETLAATDLRMGVEKHGAELSEKGIRLALDAGRPRRLLEWLDRSRARSLRVNRVSASTDEEVADDLAELRRVTTELRQQDHGDRELERRRQTLVERISRLKRVSRSQSVAEEVSTEAIIGELQDLTLFEIGNVDGSLFAVMVKNGRASMVELGDLDDVLSELSHLRFAMRRSARRGRPLDRAGLERIDQKLFDKINLDDGPLLVVPEPDLMSLPWAALPSLRGRDLRISPSAEMWWRSRHGQDLCGDVLVAGGPDLEIADREVAQVGGVYPDARVLPVGVSVEEVRAGIDGARIAHIACHAHFSVENPMFSSLRLSDGDLYVYDIERLDAAPGQVVLSACDSGYTDAKSGEELAGLTSALLSMGTRTVVASIGLVPDTPATSDLMVDFHRGLVAGLEPAAALSRAQQDAFDDPDRFLSAASFLCIGA